MFLSSARRVSASKRAVPAFKQAIIGGDGGSGSGEEGEERERRSVLSSEAPEYFPRGGAISSCFVPQQAPQPMMMPMMHQGPVMVPMYTMYAWAPHPQFYSTFAGPSMAPPPPPSFQQQIINPARIIPVNGDGSPVSVPQLFDKAEYKMRENRLIMQEELVEMVHNCASPHDFSLVLKLAKRCRDKGQPPTARFMSSLIHQSCRLECPDVALQAAREGLGELTPRSLGFLLFRYAAVERDSRVSMELWRLFGKKGWNPTCQSVDAMVRHFVYRGKYLRSSKIILEILEPLPDNYVNSGEMWQLPIDHKTLVLAVSALQKADKAKALSEIFSHLNRVEWPFKGKASVLEQFRAWTLARHHEDWEQSLQVLSGVLHRHSTLQVDVARDLMLHCPTDSAESLRALLTEKGANPDTLLAEAQELIKLRPEHDEDSSSSSSSSSDSEDDSAEGDSDSDGEGDLAASDSDSDAESK